MVNANFEQLLQKKFSSHQEFLKFLGDLQDSQHIVYKVRTSKPNKNVANFDQFPFSYIRYQCIHYGIPRSRVSDGSRPNAKTNALDCRSYFVIELGNEGKLEVNRHICEHQHPISKFIYANYPQNRKLEADEKEYINNMQQV